MPNLITRRRFLAASAAAMAAVGHAQFADAAYGFRFNYDDEFSGDWVPWLRSVVGAATRMIQPHVIHNYTRLHSNGYNLAARVWENSNNAQEPRAYWRDKANLLEWQLRCLQINNFQPEFRIRWAYKPDAGWWGRADHGTVVIAYDRSINDVRLTGSFDLLLNAYWATTRDARNTHDVWGGVIAHEMLHNVGHSHPSPEQVGNLAAYSDSWPINILDRCVTHNGRYRGGYRTYQWLCGGRIST